MSSACIPEQVSQVPVLGSMPLSRSFDVEEKSPEEKVATSGRNNSDTWQAIIKVNY